MRNVVAHERVTDLRNKTAIEYGPLVYCAEETGNPGCFEKISFSPQDDFTIEKVAGVLGGVNLIKKKKVLIVFSLFLIIRGLTGGSGR